MKHLKKPTNIPAIKSKTQEKVKFMTTTDLDNCMEISDNSMYNP